MTFDAAVLVRLRLYKSSLEALGGGEGLLLSLRRTISSSSFGVLATQDEREGERDGEFEGERCLLHRKHASAGQ